MEEKNTFTQQEVLNILISIKCVLEKNIYYYDKLGRIKTVKINFITKNEIIGEAEDNYMMNEIFPFEQFSKTWWDSKEEAIKTANEYLKEMFCYVDMKKLKKIVNFHKNDTIYIKNFDGEILAYILCDDVYYDKNEKAIIDRFRYSPYDNYGIMEKKYFISDYGNKWALTREELIK